MTSSWSTAFSQMLALELCSCFVRHLLRKRSLFQLLLELILSLFVCHFRHHNEFLEKDFRESQMQKIVPKNVSCTLVIFWFPGADYPARVHPSILRPGHWHSPAEQQSPLRRDPSRFPGVSFQHSRSRVAALEQAGLYHHLCPCVGLTVHWASPRLSSRRARTVTQSIATPEPSCPGHPRSSRSSLRPWMCHHTWETLLSRVRCPAPEF